MGRGGEALAGGEVGWAWGQNSAGHLNAMQPLMALIRTYMTKMAVVSMCVKYGGKFHICFGVVGF